MKSIHEYGDITYVVVSDLESVKLRGANENGVIPRI